jgi:hypothetical protein
VASVFNDLFIPAIAASDFVLRRGELDHARPAGRLQ